MSAPREEVRYGQPVTVWPNGRVTFATAAIRIAYRAAEAEAADQQRRKMVRPLAQDEKRAALKARQDRGELTPHERTLCAIFGEIK